MASAKKNKKKKAQTLSLGEFLGDDAPQVITTTSWADEMEQQPDADDADYGGPPKVVINRAALPTAPRAARGANVDMSQVPTEPPFTAYIGNLPFDATSEDVERFFKGLKVLGVRLPSESGRAKGFGYAEFEDRQSLLDALALNDATMRNRQIRVDLASHGQQDRDRRDGDRDHRRGDRDGDDDKTLGDWRSGGRDKRDDSDRDRPFDRDSRGGDRYGDRSDRDRRDGYRFGGDRGRYDDRDRNRYDDRDRGRFDDRSDRGDRGRYDDRDRGRFDDRDRGRFDNRDRDDYSSKSSFGSGFRDRDRERSDRFPPRDRDRYDDRYKDGGAAREWPREGNDRPKDSEDRYRDGRERVRDDDRPREFDRSRDSRDFNRDGEKPRTDRNRDSDGGRDSGPDQDNAQRRPPRSPVRSRDSSGDRSRPESDRYRPAANGPKERPRLKLQPRSKPLEEAGQVTATSAIFGGAKPVDTAAREREIEERLMKKPGGDRVDKENRSASDDDHVPHARTSVSSDTSKPFGDDIPKRRNSGERSRKESSSSSQDGPSKKERYASSSSGKGSTRKLSNDVEDASDNESETSKKSMKKDKAAAEKTPSVKLVPAPPPKENIWEKRKSENQAAKQQPTSPAVITEDKKVEEQVEKESTMTDSASDADSCKRTQSDDGVSSCSGVSDTAAQTASIHAVEQQTKVEPTEAAPAEPPTQAQVNVWEARRKEQQDTRKAPGRGDAPPVRKTATVSVAGRGGSWAAGPPKRVEVDTHSTSQSSKKKDREKPLPTSIDAMPKLEDKCSRDWSDANKFSTLMGDEDEKGEEVAEEED